MARERLLKPGGVFAAYEYCVTDRFDPDDPDHRRLKSDMEHSGALPDMARPHEVDDALREVGFELTEPRDLAAEAPPGIPWYQPSSAPACLSPASGARALGAG